MKTCSIYNPCHRVIQQWKWLIKKKILLNLLQYILFFWGYGSEIVQWLTCTLVNSYVEMYAEREVTNTFGFHHLFTVSQCLWLWARCFSSQLPHLIFTTSFWDQNCNLQFTKRETLAQGLCVYQRHMAPVTSTAGLADHIQVCTLPSAGSTTLYIQFVDAHSVFSVLCKFISK